MNGIEKFITIFFLTSTTCAMYQKCESNPSNALCGKYNTPFETIVWFSYLKFHGHSSLFYSPEFISGCKYSDYARTRLFLSANSFNTSSDKENCNR